MAEPLFDIVFRGDIVLGHSIADVKARLGQLFKIDAAKVETLFSGGAMPLKRNLDQATAEKYRTVLTKAGAQVQLRPAGKEKAKPQTQTQIQTKAKSTVGSGPANRSESAGAVQENRPASPRAANPTFTLAPAGSLLLSSSESRRLPTLDLDLSAISLKPMEGDLLEESEKPKVMSADIQAGEYDLAPPGADLLDGHRRDELPLMEIDPDFDLADPGADLLEAADRPKQQSADIDTAHLSVLPNEH